MNEAFIQNAQNQIHNENSQRQQEPETSYGGLKFLRCTLEGRADTSRQRLSRELIDLIDRIAQSYARSEVERYRHGRQLAGMVHGQRPNIRGERSNGVER